MASAALGNAGGKRYRTFAYRATQSSRSRPYKKRRRPKEAIFAIDASFRRAEFAPHGCKETHLLKALQKT